MTLNAPQQSVDHPNKPSPPTKRRLIAFIAQQYVVLSDSIRAKCKRRGIKSFAWSCSASRATFMAATAAREMIHALVSVFLYSDSSQAAPLLRDAYRSTTNDIDGGLAATNLSRILPKLDIAGSLEGLFLDNALQNEVCSVFAAELVALFEDILFFARDGRIFTEWSFSRVVEADLFVLRKLLQSYPKASHESRLSRLCSVAGLLMGVSSKALVESYEKALISEGTRGVLDPEQSTTATNIRRILMKRIDSDSKSFKRKFRFN